MNILQLEASAISHSLCSSRTACVQELLKVIYLNIPMNITVQIKEMVTTSIFSSSSPCRLHFSTGCQKIGPKPQTLKVDCYRKTVDRSSSFGSSFGPSGIPLMVTASRYDGGAEVGIYVDGVVRCLSGVDNWPWMPYSWQRVGGKEGQ